MSKRIQDLTNIGNIALNDKVVVERVAGQTRTANFTFSVVLDTSPTLGGNLNMGSYDSIVDSNGNVLLKLTKTASAVNYLAVQNNVAGSPAYLMALGADTNINLNIKPKGTGATVIQTTGNTPLAFASGTSNQHVSSFIAANTAASRAYTLPDHSGTVSVDPLLVNVKTYGVVGDGVTDDTAALQSALNVGGPLYMPAGTYKITSTLLFKVSGTTLKGAGQNKTIISYTGSTSTIKSNTPTTTTLLWCRLEDMEILAPSNTANIVVDWAGMQFGRISNVWIAGGSTTCTALNLSANWGITECTYNIVSGCVLQLAKYCITLGDGANNNFITGCRCQPNVASGIGITMSATSAGRISCNTVISCGVEYPGNISNGVSLTNTDNTVIENVRFEGLGTAITTAASATKNSFINNYFSGCSVNQTNGSTDHTTINGTTITGSTWNGVAITVPYGGNGRATATAYAPICGGTTSTDAHQSMASGNSGQLCASQGNAALPIWTTPTYPTASGSAGKVIRADGTNNVYSTATFADTYAASNILYSNGANTVTGLATANNGVLVTSAGGVPSIATDIPTAVTIGGAYNYRAGGTDVTVSDGGTGVSSCTAYAVLCGGTTSTGALQSIASVGTAGQVLTSNGAGALPTMQNAAANNLVGCFKAYKNGTQALSAATFTKVQLTSEDFDVSGVFDSVTNYRHTPTTAGKYNYVGSVYFASPTASDTLQVVLYKNGAAAAESVMVAPTTGNVQIEVSGLFDMNGSTDYIELYAYRTSAGNIGAATNFTTTLHGFLIG